MGTIIDHSLRLLPLAGVPVTTRECRLEPRPEDLRRATALVGDSARLVPTGARPTAHPEDNDGAILKACWERVLTGATAAECETAAPVDSFRVRRLLAHWVSEGSLRLAAEGTPMGKGVVIRPAPTHYEIAARIGSHREAVTREFNRLEENRIVEIRRRQIRIVNLDLLRFDEST